MVEEGKRYLFRKGDPSLEDLRKWWTCLNNYEKGERAALRRVVELDNVFYQPSYHKLYESLKKKHGDRINRSALAAVVGLAAHVIKEGPKSLPHQMATPKAIGGRAVINSIRFRRLLAADNQEELYPLMVRVVRQLKREVNLTSLADSIYWWNKNTRRDWAFKYWSDATKSAEENIE